MKTVGSARWLLSATAVLLLAGTLAAQATADSTRRSPPPPAAGATWVDLGSGLSGVQGVPRLEGFGTLLPGSSGTLELSDAAPLAPCVLLVSLSSSPVPFKGGTLVAFPPNLQFVLATDAVGEATVGWGSWPDSLPSTLELFFQYIIADAAAPQGFALSNALVGTVP
jgi:hypothetical protein